MKFDSAAVALEEAASLKEGKVPDLLAGLLADLKSEKKASLAVADTKLGTSVSHLPDLNIQAVTGSETTDLFRGVREHLSSLIPGLSQEAVDNMALGLSHSMSRHKLKFSADKVDSMIIQSVKMLDDLDKDLNVYVMRTKEWYGWHFPELAKVLNDNVAYARIVLAAGMRENISTTDLSEILPEELEETVKKAAEMSMGTDITEADLTNIKSLAEQVVEYGEHRAKLSSFLENRMQAIAPNLTALVGVLVGARLIAHAGSLINLAKAPGSTIQILGAEKALFRALKTKHDTPKYGIIYHTSLIGQATGRNKGKVARMLAAKTALGLRVDALDEELDDKDEDERSALGTTSRIKLENQLRKLEGKAPLPRGTHVAPTGDILGAGQFALKETRIYNVDADGVTNGLNGDAEEGEGKKSKKDKKDKKKEKKSKIEVVEESDEDMADANGAEDSSDESEIDFERLAAEAGISVVKFKRKYERGDVTIDENGKPQVISKKELKKQRKAAEKSTPVKVEATPEKSKKKRKHEVEDDDEVEDTKEKKKQKKKSKSSA